MYEYSTAHFLYDKLKVPGISWKCQGSNVYVSLVHNSNTRNGVQLTRIILNWNYFLLGINFNILNFGPLFLSAELLKNCCCCCCWLHPERLYPEMRDFILNWETLFWDYILNWATLSCLKDTILKLYVETLSWLKNCRWFLLYIY